MNGVFNVILNQGVTGANFATLFDALNLQSDNPANFVLSGSSVSQWTDLSTSARHATQATAANKPSYTGGAVVFDGSNDYLTLASEINLSVFSLYLVFKFPTASTTNAIVISGTSVNDYLQLIAPMKFSFQKASSGGASGYLGGEGIYQVISIRVNGTSGTILRANDRSPMNFANNLSSPGYHFGQIGRFNLGSNLAGSIKSVMVSSQYLDDATDLSVRVQLYSKYNFSSQAPNIVALGDSNTAGGLTGGTYTQGWLYQLATYFGQSEVNLGINGTALQPGSTDNGYDRYPTQLVTRPYRDRIVIMYSNSTWGANDATTYAAALNPMVADLISRGYSPSNICLCSPAYRTGNADAANLNATRSAIITIKNTYGTAYADTLQAIRDNGGDSLMTDTIHFNVAGAAIIYQTIRDQSGWT